MAVSQMNFPQKKNESLDARLLGRLMGSGIIVPSFLTIVESWYRHSWCQSHRQCHTVTRQHQPTRLSWWDKGEMLVEIG